MKSNSTQKKLYLAGISVALLTSIFLIYKLFSAPFWMNLVILAVMVAVWATPNVRKIVEEKANEIYCAVIYENSVFWELFYDFVIFVYPSTQLNQINYGYAPLTKDGVLIPIEGQDQAERMSLQLYWRTVTALETRTDLKGLTVLEVSSGRGGGLDFLTRKYDLKKGIGLDLSSKSIHWCKEAYSKNPKLEFIEGNAESFVDDKVLSPESIDVVISVDSSHLYPNPDRFVTQCMKVLKKGGILCISDFMATEKLETRGQLMENVEGLKLLKKEATTENILHAMDLDGERRKELVETHTSNILLKMYFRWQTGAKGSRIHTLLKTGQFKGSSWAFEKI